MAKPELGTKRTCPTTGRKFYDLNQDPIVSPYTGQSYPRSAFEPTARSVPAARPRAVQSEDAVEPVADAGAELVSLQEVEAAETDKAGEDEVELADETAPDEAFIEEEDGGEDDVTDLIDGDLEDDEET
jgi:uncharacterized protein (TIGR02300 family)